MRSRNWFFKLKNPTPEIFKQPIPSEKTKCLIWTLDSSSELNGYVQFPTSIKEVTVKNYLPDASWTPRPSKMANLEAKETILKLDSISTPFEQGEFIDSKFGRRKDLVERTKKKKEEREEWLKEQALYEAESEERFRKMKEYTEKLEQKLKEIEEKEIEEGESTYAKMKKWQEAQKKRKVELHIENLNVQNGGTLNINKND